MSTISLHGYFNIMRGQGWSCAVHNDYRLNGQPHTFYLWTHEKSGRFVKGEGGDDLYALALCYEAINAPAQPDAELAKKADEYLERLPIKRHAAQPDAGEWEAKLRFAVKKYNSRDDPTWNDCIAPIFRDAIAAARAQADKAAIERACKAACSYCSLGWGYEEGSTIHTVTTRYGDTMKAECRAAAIREARDVN